MCRGAWAVPGFVPPDDNSGLPRRQASTRTDGPCSGRQSRTGRRRNRGPRPVIVLVHSPSPTISGRQTDKAGHNWYRPEVITGLFPRPELMRTQREFPPRTCQIRGRVLGGTDAESCRPVSSVMRRVKYLLLRPESPVLTPSSWALDLGPRGLGRVEGREGSSQGLEPLGQTNEDPTKDSHSGDVFLLSRLVLPPCPLIPTPPHLRSRTSGVRWTGESAHPHTTLSRQKEDRRTELSLYSYVLIEGTSTPKIRPEG